MESSLFMSPEILQSHIPALREFAAAKTTMPQQSRPYPTAEFNLNVQRLQPTYAGRSQL